jgi:purine-binding chemotaxis protein CheW
MLKLVPLPQKHPLLEGFANIRGQFIPVIGVRQILGLPALEPQLNTPILLTLNNGRLIGLIVDEVSDVVALPAEQIARPDALIPNSMEGVAVLLGVTYIDGQPVLLIDPDHLLIPTQIRALNQAIEALAEQIEGQGKPRKRRKNLSSALADQVATIALDLPPVDGAFPLSSEAQQPDCES